MPAVVNLSIVIVNWNTCDLLSGCLRTVEQSVRAATAIDVETLVVDNASTDGSADMVRSRFPWVKLIVNPENAGFAAANNQGMRMASGRYVLLLNSDTIVHPHSLPTLVEFMEAHPQAGACGPRLLNGDGSLQHGCVPVLTPGREFWRLLFLDRWKPRSIYPIEVWDTFSPRQVEAIKGACLLLRRCAIEQVGMLDERYFMYTEEIDLCYRLGEAKWELWYVPKAIVTHYGEASSSQMAETMYVQLYRSKVQFYRKFGGARRARIYKSLLILVYTPRFILSSFLELANLNHRARSRTYRRLLTELSKM